MSARPSERWHRIATEPDRDVLTFAFHSICRLVPVNNVAFGAKANLERAKKFAFGVKANFVNAKANLFGTKANVVARSEGALGLKANLMVPNNPLSAPGVVYFFVFNRKTTPASLQRFASRHFIDRSATPPCSNARRGLRRSKRLNIFSQLHRPPLPQVIIRSDLH
jgi:hypothetical protein